MPVISRNREPEPDVIPPQPVQPIPDVINVKIRIRKSLPMLCVFVGLIIIAYIVYTMYGYPEPPPANETVVYRTGTRHDDERIHYEPVKGGL